MGDIRNKVAADISSYLADIITGFMTDDARCYITISSRLRLEHIVISHIVHRCIIYYITARTVTNATGDYMTDRQIIVGRKGVPKTIDDVELDRVDEAVGETADWEHCRTTGRVIAVVKQQ